MINRKFRGAALLAVVSVFGLAMAQEAITLRRVVKEGDKENYSIVSNIKQFVTAPQGEQEVTITSSQKWAIEYGKADAGKTPLTIKISDIKIDMAGMPMGGDTPDIPKEMTATAKIDEMNMFSDYKVSGLSGAAGQMMQMMGGSMTSMMMGVNFPKDAVKMGGTWDIDIKADKATGIGDAKLKATLVEATKVGDEEAYKISYVGALPMKLDSANMPKIPDSPMGEMNFTITGTIDVTGTVMVAKATGKLLQMDTKFGGKQKLDLADMGMSMDIRGDSSMAIKLVK